MGTRNRPRSTPALVGMLLVISLGWASWASPPQPPVLAERLRHAAERNAVRELEEIGSRARPGDLLTVLAAPDRTLVLGAIGAAPGARGEDAWLLLEPLARLALSADAPVAMAAARSAARIAAGLAGAGAVAGVTGHERLMHLELAEHELAPSMSAWQAVGADSTGPAGVRVHALEVTTRLAALAPGLGPAYDLDARARDESAEVRRAALELVSQPMSRADMATVARAVARDAEPAVALAAAQALCSGLAPGVSRVPARTYLDALGKPGLERLRALVLHAGLSPAALLDAARCLAADSGADSRRALKKLQTRGPLSIRRMVGQLGKRKQ